MSKKVKKAKKKSNVIYCPKVLRRAPSKQVEEVVFYPKCVA